ncbi:MAG: ATPase domain-containing protein [Burkholderiales bacterium]|nr:ATPase domain-containing protein [Burkholderiales bacterium]
MADRDLVKTGIRGLDSILSDGIPRGNLILLEGAIGTGKTTLGVEFVYRGASQFDEPGIIVLFEISPDKIVRDAAQLGWDLPALERARTLKIIFTTRQVFGQELQQADSVLLEEAAEMGARRIFVDGVPGVIGVPGNGGGVEARDTFHVLAEGLQRENLTAVLAVEATAFNDQRLMALPEETIADTVIRLRMEEVTRAAVRSIEIVKSRGHDFQMGRHTFKIVDGRGMQVYRRVQAPRRPSRDEAAAFDLTTRITTGVPGLDALVNGGYLLGSTTVISGISGVGKSVMGLQYVAEGARCGQRSLMLSLDEQVPQIIRNANSIGIDFQQLIDSGIVLVQYDTPQEIEIDHHFHGIEQLVQEFKPTRVLFDSLSTYGSNLGTEGRMFRDFFHALVALMKEHQTVTVYNHENPEMLGMASMMGDFHMSSLVDNILLMNWIELGDAFRLGLTVAKMRANPNTRATHECEILNGQGMRVLPRQIPASMIRPFSSYQNLISRNPARSPDPSST